jgi:hypothetical protein
LRCSAKLPAPIWRCGGAPAAVSLGEAAIMVEMPDRVLHTPARLKEAREIVMAVDVVGLTLQCLLIRCDRLIKAILVLQ